MADYTQAIRLNPNDVAAYINRGHVYERKGEYTSARTDYTRALQLDPNNVEARRRLAESVEVENRH
jgi:Flp pilus assembly protein TadD